MADGHHLKTVKSQYLSTGLTDRREMWHDAYNGPMNLLCHPIHYAYYFT